ncbi:MAG: DUF4875 domain-containing protein [Oxalobacter sp.]|nr:DUF4875 domain-containing protein [Oxalobacter sp.]
MVSSRWLSLPVACAVAISLSGCINDKNDTGLTKTKASALKMDDTVKSLPYEEVGNGTITAENRRWVTVDLALAPEVTEANQGSLVATCMGAAKYEAAKHHAPIVSISLYDAKGNAKVPVTSMTLVAVCSYSPDGKGRNGRERWTWEQISAANETTSATAKQVALTWHEVAEQLTTKGRISKEVIAEAVGKRLNMPAADVLAAKPVLNLLPVNPSPEFEKLPELPPAGNPAQ